MDEKPRYHVENLPESLLEVGSELLSYRPHDSFRLRELASLVPEKPGGVSHTAVFGHYSSMPDYLTALAVRWWGLLEEELRFESSADTPVDLGLRYVRFALDNPHAFRLMYDNQLWGTPTEGRVAMHRREEMARIRDLCFTQFALATRAARWGQALTQQDVQSWARLFAALSHGLAMELIDEQLFGHVHEADERKRRRLGHAKELLELATKGVPA